MGLILKLASESQGSRSQAVHTVRQKARSCPEVSGGTLDAIRLAVTQHEDIATAMLADIDTDCRQAKPATTMEVKHCPFETLENIKILSSAVVELLCIEVLFDMQPLWIIA